MSTNNIYEKLLVPTDRAEEIQPLDNMILVKVDAPESKTQGGIYLAETTVNQEARGRIIGTVLKKGPKADFCEVGEEVIFAKYSGTVCCKTEGYELRLMEDTDLKAILRKDIKK